MLVARGDGAYEFRHALLREAAYAELLPGERERLHAELADELEARPARRRGRSAPAELAHHRHAAGELDRALRGLGAAGEEAARVHAHPEALRHFQRALELWERVAPAAAGLRPRRGHDAAARRRTRRASTELAIALAAGRSSCVDARAEPLRAGVLHARLAQLPAGGGRRRRGAGGARRRRSR